MLGTLKDVLNNFIFFLICALREKKEIIIKVKFEILISLSLYLNAAL